MEKIFHIFFSFMLFASTVYAQVPLVKQWDKRFGGSNDDALYSLLQTIDGGYILGGESMSPIGWEQTQPPRGGMDYWIVKIDSLGIKQWDKRFGGTDDDFFRTVKRTSDNGFILGGYTTSGISGDKTQPSQGWQDYWIVKTDSLGNLQWEKRFGGTDADWLYALQQTKDGGYILGGGSYSGMNGDKTQTSRGGEDYWIIKIDSLGNYQWDKRFGGTGTDDLQSLSQTRDGGYILGGLSSSGVSGDKTQPSWGGLDYWIVKIDSVGNYQWDKRYGGAADDYCFALQQIADGGYIIGGRSGSGISGDKTESTWGGWDYWIIKIDSIGNIIWNKDYGGTSHDEFQNISQTSDKGYLLSGTSYSQASGDKTENNLGVEQTWVIKTDSLGNKKWDKTLRTATTDDDETGVAIETFDGCYTMANWTYAGIGGDKTQPSRGWSDYWVIKFCDTTRAVANYLCSDNSICVGSCIAFSNQSLNANSYQWIFNGGIPPSSSNPNPLNICYNSPGSFDVTLIATNTNGNDTLTFLSYINVFSTPQSPVLSQHGDTLIAPQGYSNYQWYFGSTPINGATNYFYAATQAGIYDLIVTDNNGCDAKSSIKYIPCEFEVIIPNVFTPNGDGINDTYHIDNLCFGNNFLFSVFNRWGEKIFETGEKNFHWDGSTFNKKNAVSGVYFYILLSGDHEYHGFITLIRK